MANFMLLYCHDLWLGLGHVEGEPVRLGEGRRHEHNAADNLRNGEPAAGLCFYYLVQP